MMPPRIDDRWLWLAFGVVFVASIGGIRYAINDIVRLTRLERYPDESEIVKKGERPEDDISLDDLRTLIDSPNPNTAYAATRLFLSRFGRQPNAYRTVIKDSNSKDETTRTRARQALAFLQQWPTPPNILGEDIDIPRYGPSSSRASSIGAESVGNIRSFADLGEDGWTDLAAATSAAHGVVIPSIEDPVAGWTSVPRERPSASEADRRRSRREAMVLREGGGGVEEGDIIRPMLHDGDD